MGKLSKSNFKKLTVSKREGGPALDSTKQALMGRKGDE